VTAGCRLPADEGEALCRRTGGGATLNGDPITVSRPHRCGGGTALATRPNVQPKHWKGGVPPFNAHHRPSIAYRLALVGEGRFDVMLTFRDTWEWDIAAGVILVEEAGGTSPTPQARASGSIWASRSAPGIMAAPGAARGAICAIGWGPESGETARPASAGICAETLAIAVTSNRAPRAIRLARNIFQHVTSSELRYRPPAFTPLS
jgi:hypothetical protein